VYLVVIKEDLDQGLNNEGNALMKTKHEYNVSPSQCPYLIPPPFPQWREGVSMANGPLKHEL